MMDISTEIIRFLGAIEYILGGLTLRTSQNTSVTGENNPLKAGNTRNACTTDEIETAIKNYHNLRDMPRYSLFKQVKWQQYIF